MNGCVEWNGYRGPTGYGRRKPPPGGSWLVHRQAWIEKMGEIPKGLELDHLCCNKACYNIEHLELVTHAENMRRAAVNGLMRGIPSNRHAAKTTRAQRVAMRHADRCGGLSHARIGELLGVSQKTVSDVVSGRTWKGGQ